MTLTLSPKSLLMISIQITFLLYYQVILGYLLSLFLRIGLRMGIVNVIQTKKKSSNDNDEEEEWKIKTNFISLFRYDTSTILSSSSFSFLKCNYFRKVYNANRNEEEKEEEELIDPQYISILSSIPTCQIGSISISPFTTLKGVTKSRTYLLALALQQIHIKLQIQLEINENENHNNINEYENENGMEHSNNRNQNQNDKRKTKLDIDIGLCLNTVSIYLFSQGIISYLFRRLKNKIFNTNSNNNANAEKDANKSNNRDENTKKKQATNKVITDLLPKLLGGIDIMDLYVSISIRASSSPPSLSTLSVINNYNYKATINVKQLNFKLESKSFGNTNDINNHTTTTNTNYKNGDDDEIKVKNDNNDDNESRIFLLSAEMNQFKIELLNNENNNNKNNNEGTKQQKQEIFVNHSTFSFTLSETSSSPAHIQIHTSDNIDICISISVIIGFLSMILQIILPCIDTIVLMTAITSSSSSTTITTTNNKKGVDKDNQSKTKCNTIHKHKKKNKQNLSINTGIKLTLLDDRDELQLLQEKQSFKLSFSISFDNNSFETSKEGLSIIFSNVSLIHNITKNDDVKTIPPGRFHLNIDRTSLLLGQSTDDEEDSNELFIGVGILSMHCTDVNESEYIIGIGLYVLNGLVAVLPKKKHKETHNTNNNPPTKCLLSLACNSLDLVVNLPRCLNRSGDDDNDEIGVQIDANVQDILVSVTPPDNSSQPNASNGEAIVEVSNLGVSLSFTPHSTLPTFDQCIQKVTGEEVNDKYLNGKNEFILKYVVSGSQFKMFALLPVEGSEEKREIIQEQNYLDMVVTDTLIKEEMYFPLSTGLESDYVVAHCTDTIHFVLSKSKVLDSSNVLFVVQNIELQTETGTLIIKWSPVLQWFITSAVTQFFRIIENYVSLINKNKKVKKNIEKPKIISNIIVNTNDTFVQLSAVLGGKSVCDVVANNLMVKVSKEIHDTWDKPNVVCDVGIVSVNINNSDFDVVKISSFRFSDTLRRASHEEIRSYSTQKDIDCYSFDELATGSCGTPLFERFELSFGDYTRVNMPPFLHLGKFIEDITQTEKSVKEGLLASGMIKKAPFVEKKYQLMDIHFTIPMIDANFLETRPTNKFSHFPGIKFGDNAHHPMLNRWRFHIKDLSVLIKRNSPPKNVQVQLQELDEDKSRRYIYGPMIQGGHFTLNITHITCILHPLNAVSPLGDIKNLTLNGLIFLTALSPENEGINYNGESFCVPVHCHHNCRCRCDFGVIMEKGFPPPKIYYDVQLSSATVHSNYGPLMNRSLPGLLNIIQRFIPSSPYTDVHKRFQPKLNTTSPLSPWDNMRNQFHGQFTWIIETVSFRWLLDTATRCDWSILLTTKNLQLSHLVGFFTVEMSDTIVSIPNSSYHLLHLKEREQLSNKLLDSIKFTQREGQLKRHSLLLIPQLEVSFGFEWEVPFPEANNSTYHHIPYFLDHGLPTTVVPCDNFEHFRSKGVHLFLSVNLTQTSHYGNWVALRADVLPWLTHKFEDNFAKEEDGDGANEKEISNDDINITGIQIDVSINQLHIGAWFEETAEFISNDHVTSEGLVEGLYLTIPEARYSMNDQGRNRIDVDGIQAALLDLDRHNLSYPSISRFNKHVWALAKWQSILNSSEIEEMNNLQSFHMFQCLHKASMNLKTLDYLIIVDQINVLDSSLEEIMSSSNNSSSKINIVNEQSLQKTKAPWTVLVAEMKLLWTLEIRDRVLTIVKDVLFAINFMKVNARGTPQLLHDADNEAIKHVLVTDTNEGVELTPKHNTMNTATSNPCEDTSIEVKSSETGVTVHVESQQSKKYDMKSKNQPKSFLDDVFLGSTGNAGLYNVVSATESNESEETALDTRDDISKLLQESPATYREYNQDTIPTFDLHLSNPQIQFHSEKTGGSVIISMRGAYIEMKMFSHLFCKENDFQNHSFSVETLLRRSEFIYTLDRMELYSLSTNVDVDTGLQWLRTKQDQNTSDETIKSSTNFGEGQDHFTTLNSFEAEESLEKSFPPDMQKHEIKKFILPSFCQKIMEPCTFKTIQTFDRPPIDLTREELNDTIEKMLISSLTSSDTNKAIDHLELFIDELSFLLDSHQFSTTLDVIRNVLLEPMQPDRERYYKANTEISKYNKEEKTNPRRNDADKSHALEKMEFAVRQWEQQKTKKGREYLRELANELCVEAEENQGNFGEQSIRRIEYTLSKAKWKVATSDIVNEAEISFTGFKGIHNYTADGSVHSQVTLEDIYVETTKPGSESMHFNDPAAIIKTIIGNERSACNRCGKHFDRTANAANACTFHPGSFALISKEGIRGWTCCKAQWEAAPGCISRPHTGKERAVQVRMDAFPRTVEGLTMYKHIEANIYPGVPHTIIVQLTKSLTKSFMKYFLGDGNKDDFSFEQDASLNVSYSTPKQRRRANTDSSSDPFDGFPGEDDISLHSSMSGSIQSENLVTAHERQRKNILFGGMMKRNNSLSKTTKRKDTLPKSVSNDHNTRKDTADSKQSVTKKKKKDSMSRDKKSNAESNEKDLQKHGEIVFVKYWRVGNININLSVAGFGRIVDLSNQSVNVPFFQKAYKIGSSRHLINKLVKHFIASLVQNSFDIIRNKIGGKQQKLLGDDMRSPTIAFSRSALDDIYVKESEDGEAEVKVSLFAVPVTRARRNTAGTRSRLYTR